MKKRPRAVVDTNIFISSLLGSKTCRAITEYFENQKFTLILSEFIIKEIKITLTNKRIGNILNEDIENLSEFFLDSSKIIFASLVASVFSPKLAGDFPLYTFIGGISLTAFFLMISIFFNKREVKL